MSWCVLLACVVMVCDATLSGFYADNGVDQTVVEHVLTSQEKRQLEREMLALLGLQARPRAPHATSLNNSASRFLLDVYRYKSSQDPSFSLARHDLQAVDHSDAIMSFVSLDHRTAAVRHERGNMLWFDVSEVPANEMILGSELRLYQTATDVGPGASIIVSLYQLSAISEGQRELQLVDNISTSCNHEGWLLLNATVPFISWVAFQGTNLGLYLSVHLSTHPDQEKRPEEMGITVDSHKEGHEPFLVAFLKAPLQRQFHIREVRDTAKRRRRVSDSSWDTGYTQDSFHSNKLRWNHVSKSCQIHNLLVNFAELKWDDWVITPEQFNAFFCSGECNFPLNSHVNPTNHAIVQTLAHLENPQKVPKPCCAPTKLAPATIMHYTDDNTFVVQNYNDMIVMGCGCH